MSLFGYLLKSLIFFFNEINTLRKTAGDYLSASMTLFFLFLFSLPTHTTTRRAFLWNRNLGQTLWLLSRVPRGVPLCNVTASLPLQPIREEL